MLAAYYSKGCDSEEMFLGPDISRESDFRTHLNKYDVIHLDIQWFLANCGNVDNVVAFITKSVQDELREIYPGIFPDGEISLSECLSRIKNAVGQKFIVIIDEWDVLIRDEAANKKVQEKEIGGTMTEEQKRKIKNYDYLNQIALKGKTLFTGLSLMEMFPICEIARSRGIEEIVYNRGVGGLNTDEFLEYIHILLLDLEPSKIFINIGTNDITEERVGNQWFDHLMDNYRKMLEIIYEKLDKPEVYVMAFYPANLHLPWQTAESIEWMKLRTPENIERCNKELKKIAKSFGCNYLDCNIYLVDKNGEQKTEYAIDGVHMYANGYLKVFDSLVQHLH